ncbi:MAG: hypothetical protein M9894_38315 [Planctomycetes bacterium]|nr:hypothetical protein [Planctomycetota bacterium]
MSAGNARGRAPVVAPLLLAAMLAVHALGLDAALRLDAPDPARALLCHLGHGSAAQLLWAGVATACLALALEARVRRAWLLGLLAASAVGVSAVVVLAERGFVATYVGSSGVGHALAMAWALVALPGPWRVGAAGLLVAKVAGELVTGGLLLPDPGLAAAGMVAVPAAHAAGVLAGAAWSVAPGLALRPAPAPVVAT